MFGVEDPVGGDENEGLEQEEDQDGVAQRRGEKVALDVFSVGVITRAAKAIHATSGSVSEPET